MQTATKYPGTATAVSSGSGGGWTTVNNIKADDGSSASGDISSGGYYSGTLQGSNYGFSIPTALKIIGVIVEMRITGSLYTDVTVSLQKSGGTTSANRIGPGAAANGITTYGGQNDLWGFSSLTPSDINNSAFGVNYEARNTSGGGGNVFVDFMRMTVYYGPADKPFDKTIRKVYHAKVSKNDLYLGILPNVYDNFEFSDETNTAGSDTTIMVASGSETARTDGTFPLLEENGSPLLAEDGSPLLGETSNSLVGLGGSSAIISNGNTVVVYEYSPYYPNGIPIFRGRIDKWNDSGNRISVNLKSDGQDLDNSVLVGPPYTYTTDQQQLTANATNTLYEGGGYQREGQTFTAGVSSLGGIYVRLSPTTTINVTIAVYASPSMGTLLGTSTVSMASTGGAATDVVVPFSPRIALTIGQQYFFTVKVNSGQSVPIAYNSGGGYAGGQQYDASYSGGSGGGGYVANSGADLYFKTAVSNGSTVVSYGTQDPTAGMLVTAMTDYNAGGGLITYSADSIQASGITVPYTFNLATMLEAIQKFCELAPANFYWYIDRGTNLLTMRAASTTADFVFIKGRHIIDIDVTPTVEQVKNIIYFSGGEVTPGVNLYKIYKNQASIDIYGKRIDRVSDSRVTVTSTADAIGQSRLAELKDEKFIATVDIADTTMDITLLKPGKVIGFAGFANYKDQLLLQIVRRSYKSHSATLTLGVLPPRQTLDIEQISRQLIAQQTVANPATPS